MSIENLLTRAREISSDAERVTEAKLRKVSLPARNGQSAGVLGLITLDNGEDHTKPNTFGPRGLLSLNDAIDAALADDEVVALGRHRQAVHPRGRRRPDVDLRRRPVMATPYAWSPSSGTRSSASSRTAASRRSGSSTGWRSAAASRSPCTAPTAPSWTAPPPSACPR